MKSVLVTTKYRGVFWGYATSEKDLPGKIVLKKARNCIYWSSDMAGFMGLSTEGPNSACKIGAQCEKITLFGITSVTPCSPEATQAWEKAPCSE
jgi:hypothetical protein